MDAREKAKQQAEVMLHFANGGVVEYVGGNTAVWREALTPLWDWCEYDYRIKKEVKTVKLFAWFNPHSGAFVFYASETLCISSNMVRVPSEDKTITLE